MKSKKVLVTGAGGFIGSTLTQCLLQEKHEVTVLDNFSFGKKAHIWPGVRLFQGSLLSDKKLSDVFKLDYDWVFHLAALHFIPYCNAHPEQTIKVNIEGTRRLLDQLNKKRLQKLFFASTAAVYDATDNYHQETDVPCPMDVYGISKLAGEGLVRQFHEQNKIPCVIGRLFNAYGPRETNPHLIPHVVQQLKNKQTTLLLGNLSPYRDYIYTQDICHYILALVKNKDSNLTTVNVASGQEYSVKQIVDMCSEIIRIPITICSKTSLQRKLERQHLRADITRLRQLTGLKPQFTFQQGIRKILQYEKIIFG